MVGKCKHESSNFKLKIIIWRLVTRLAKAGTHAIDPIPTLVYISIAGSNSNQKLPVTVTPAENPSIISIVLLSTVLTRKTKSAPSAVTPHVNVVTSRAWMTGFDSIKRNQEAHWESPKTRSPWYFCHFSPQFRHNLAHSGGRSAVQSVHFSYRSRFVVVVFLWWSLLLWNKGFY